MRVREAGQELLARLLDGLVGAVPGGTGAALTTVARAEPTRAALVGPVAAAEERVWAASGAGRQALGAGRPLLVDDDARGGRLVAVVLEEDAERAVVLTLHLDRAPEEADLHRIDHAQMLLTSAMGVLEYCAGEEERAEQMVQMVQYRRVIEQAKGLVMAATGTDAGSAFATLARASQHFNVRLRNLAVALVELVGGQPAEGPTDPAAVVTPSELDRGAAARMWAALRSSGSATGTRGGA